MKRSRPVSDSSSSPKRVKRETGPYSTAPFTPHEHILQAQQHEQQQAPPQEFPQHRTAHFLQPSQKPKEEVSQVQQPIQGGIYPAGSLVQPPLMEGGPQEIHPHHPFQQLQPSQLLQQLRPDQQQRQQLQQQLQAHKAAPQLMQKLQVSSLPVPGISVFPQDPSFAWSQTPHPLSALPGQLQERLQAPSSQPLHPQLPSQVPGIGAQAHVTQQVRHPQLQVQQPPQATSLSPYTVASSQVGQLTASAVPGVYTSTSYVHPIGMVEPSIPIAPALDRRYLQSQPQIPLQQTGGLLLSTPSGPRRDIIDILDPSQPVSSTSFTNIGLDPITQPGAAQITPVDERQGQVGLSSQRISMLQQERQRRNGTLLPVGVPITPLEQGVTVRRGGLVPGAVGRRGAGAHGGLTYTCRTCGQVFDQKRERDEHARTAHEKERNFACPKCPARFKTRSDCNRHNRIVHERVRPFHCPLCTSAFAERGKLRRHVSTVHEKRRPHACPECGACFGERGNLNQHRASKHQPPPDSTA